MAGHAVDKIQQLNAVFKCGKGVIPTDRGVNSIIMMPALLTVEGKNWEGRDQKSVAKSAAPVDMLRLDTYERQSSKSTTGDFLKTNKRSRPGQDCDVQEGIRFDKNLDGIGYYKVLERQQNIYQQESGLNLSTRAGRIDEVDKALKRRFGVTKDVNIPLDPSEIFIHLTPIKMVRLIKQLASRDTELKAKKVIDGSIELKVGRKIANRFDIVTIPILRLRDEVVENVLKPFENPSMSDKFYVEYSKQLSIKNLTPETSEDESDLDMPVPVSVPVIESQPAASNLESDLEISDVESEPDLDMPDASTPMSKFESEEPALPSMPLIKSAPEWLSMPITESASSLPSMPIIKSAPSLPSMPIIESAPSLPSMPIIESAPSLPSMPIIESAPALPNMPIIESAPSLPSMPIIESQSDVSDIPSIETDRALLNVPVIESKPTTSNLESDLGMPDASAPILSMPVIGSQPTTSNLVESNVRNFETTSFRRNSDVESDSDQDILDLTIIDNEFDF